MAEDTRTPKPLVPGADSPASSLSTPLGTLPAYAPAAAPPSAPGGDKEGLEEQLGAVRAIGEALAMSVGLDDLFVKIVPEISQLMRADRSTLFLYDAQTNQIWSKIAQGEGGRVIKLDIGIGIAGWVAAHKKPLNIADAYDDDRFNPAVDKRTGYRTRSVAVVPLLDRHNELIGVIQVLNHEGGPFNNKDMGLLNTIGIQIGYTIENARQAQEIIDQNTQLQLARQRAELRGAELDLLYQLEQEASASTDLSEFIDSIILRACQRLHSEAGSVLLLGEGEPLLFFRGDGDEDALHQESHNPEDSVIGRVAHGGKHVIINDAADDAQHAHGLSIELGYQSHAMVAVPLAWGGQVIGAMEVMNPAGDSNAAGTFSDEDVKVLTLIAGQVARGVSLNRQREQRAVNERLAFLGRMLAGVAHDLRNPMTVISGYAQIMALEARQEERSARCERILTQIDEMTAMVADLLAFARGDAQLKPSVISLERLASEIEDSIGMQCRPRGIEFILEHSGGTALVDLGRVKRIVFNLAKNAIDVLVRGSKLEIKVTERDRGILVQVTDDGPGIPPEVKARMFDAFVSSHKASGTGLGLSIVKRFVDDHGGHMKVESVAGKGTTFYVDLPPATMRPGE